MEDLLIKALAVLAAMTLGTTALVFFTTLGVISLSAFGVISSSL